MIPNWHEPRKPAAVLVKDYRTTIDDRCEQGDADHNGRDDDDNVHGCAREAGARAAQSDATRCTAIAIEYTRVGAV